MTRPVILPDGSAYLADGRHIPEADLRRAVALITAACEAFAALPAEVRAALEAEREEGS